MANSGIKQATIAYKVSRPGGLPLDIDGKPVDVTGKKQAIALLEGRPNPDPLLYEVETYFTVGGTLTGNAMQEYDPVTCPVGLMYVTPAMLVLTPANPVQIFTLFSANPWVMLAGPIIATLIPTAGTVGTYSITATRTGVQGQGYFVFQDSLTQETVGIYIVNTTDPDAWILETGSWNGLGFWQSDGIWNF